MVKGNLIIGIIFCMIMLKKLLKVIIIKKPIPTPKQKGKVFDKPCCLANTITSFMLYVIMSEMDIIMLFVLLYITYVILYINGG